MSLVERVLKSAETSHTHTQIKTWVNFGAAKARKANWFS